MASSRCGNGFLIDYFICMRHLFAGALRNQYAFEPPQFYDPPKPRRSHVPPPVTKRSEIRPL